MGIGFNAAAYDMDGTIVISFRGMDASSGVETVKDALTGWLLRFRRVSRYSDAVKFGSLGVSADFGIPVQGAYAERLDQTAAGRSVPGAARAVRLGAPGLWPALSAC